MAAHGGMAAWQSQLQWMDDDEDQDSDTDSKLSGSAIVDSVMKQLRKRGHKDRLYPGGEFALDPVADQSYEEEMEDVPSHMSSEGWEGRQQFAGVYPDHHRAAKPLSNGSSETRPPNLDLNARTSPRHLGLPGRSGNARPPYQGHEWRNKKDILSPVPETTSSGARVVEVSAPLYPPAPGGQLTHSNGPGTHSMENIHFNTTAHMHTPPPSALGRSRSGYKTVSISQSHEVLPRTVFMDDFSSGGGDSHTRHGSFGSNSRSHVPPARRSPYQRHEIPRDTSAHSSLQGEVAGRHPDPSRDAADRLGGMLGRLTVSQAKEPNLNDVIDFLSSDDPGLVANAASYLQHLAYGDDSMKAKIRQFGGIPVLVIQLRNCNTRVQMSVLGALKNLSYGRTNDENRQMIVTEHGLPELLLALKNSTANEVRELITAVLWNISSSEDLKITIIKECLEDLVNFILIPCCHWRQEAAVHGYSSSVCEIQWCVELRNLTGCLKNISSAGEAARGDLRRCNGLVDCLLNGIKSSLTSQHSDEKTVEFMMCILRNLSYRLEEEIDPQEGADDVLDREWEQEQWEEIEEDMKTFRPSRSSGFLSMCVKPRTLERPATQMLYPVDLTNPDPSVLPRRRRPVFGMELLWQPEVVHPYLALIDKCGASSETLEAAVGAIQNLTACSWKWAAYTRVFIRNSLGLPLIVDLMNNVHDGTVRAAAQALQNLISDPRNKATIGKVAIGAALPRLPFGQNHLGISENTTVALLCCVTELCSESPENARVLLEKGGIPLIVRLTRSRQHIPTVIFAAHKLCSVLYEYKECKFGLRREGWDLSIFIKLSKEHQFDAEQLKGSPKVHHTGHGHKHKKEKKKQKKSSSSPKISRGDHPLPQIPQDDPPPQYNIQDIQQPGYSMAADPPPPKSSSPPLVLYQSIDDPQIQSAIQSVKQSQPESVTSGQLSAASEEFDPNATYAEVNIEKKRASRRKKRIQQQDDESADVQQIEEPTVDSQTVDSWV